MKNKAADIQGSVNNLAAEIPTVSHDGRIAVHAGGRVADNYREIKKGEVLLDLYHVVTEPNRRGGMGLVYQVHHKDWKIDLAMKQPKAKFFNTEQQKKDFKAECEQ